jgi:hypothetical protein
MGHHPRRGRLMMPPERGIGEGRKGAGRKGLTEAETSVCPSHRRPTPRQLVAGSRPVSARVAPGLVVFDAHLRAFNHAHAPPGTKRVAHIHETFSPVFLIVASHSLMVSVQRTSTSMYFLNVRMVSLLSLPFTLMTLSNARVRTCFAPTAFGVTVHVQMTGPGSKSICSLEPIGDTSKDDEPPSVATTLSDTCRVTCSTAPASLIKFSSCFSRLLGFSRLLESLESFNSMMKGTPTLHDLAR